VNREAGAVHSLAFDPQEFSSFMRSGPRKIIPSNNKRFLKTRTMEIGLELRGKQCLFWQGFYGFE